MFFRKSEKRKRISAFTAAAFLAVAASASLMSACEKEEAAISENLPYLYNIEPDYENMVFDNFSEGIDSDKWLIAHQAWGDDNGGVIKENVGYTDDGLLVLTGNGNYYKGNLRGVGKRSDGTKTGGALISDFTVGPGRYEVKMKVLPRVGACSAFWTFSKPIIDGKTENHEIDIEFPGNADFRKIWNTSYINLENTGKENYKTEISPVNDGEWHTYGFDWMTNPARIVYYFDGKQVAEATTIVPYREGRIWVGVWFPLNWTGNPNFDTDYMFVDYIKYIPFKNQPCYEFQATTGTVAEKRDYPDKPIRVEKNNSLANGDFGSAFSENESENAWTKGRFTGVTDSADTLSAIVYDGDRRSDVIEIRQGGFISQYIDAVYEGYTYQFDFDAYAADENASVQIMFYPGQDTAIATENIEIAPNEWRHYTKTVTAPTGTERIRIRVSSKGGTLKADNIKAVFKGKA